MQGNVRIEPKTIFKAKLPPQKRVRDSNLELLRIVSMFLVLIIHYIPTRGAVTLESLSDNFWYSLGSLELRSLSFVCVHCFILLSGFFGIHWRFKSFASLLFQILFWGILGYLIAMTLPIPYGNGSLEFVGWVNWIRERWFISAYLLLYILSPILNAFIKKCTEQELGKYILVFYLFSTIYGYFIKSYEFNAGTSAVSLFGLYLVGAYLKKTTLPIATWNKWYDLSMYLGIGAIMVLISILLLKLGIQSSIYGYLNPLVILESIFLFQFFRKYNIPYNRIINWIAASAFAAYLFHYHCFLCDNYFKILNDINTNSNYPFIAAMLFIIIVFFVAIFIDKIRILLFKLTFGFLARFWLPKDV